MAFRILIVDDSPAMRSVIRRTLQMSGIEVAGILEASSGQEALDRLQTEPADLILADINMPGMDGEELIRRLAADEVLRFIPAIVITTDATPQRVERLRALGASGYIAKPFTPAMLCAELERVLGALHE